ncbi:MAG: rhodanese-related sulfurtransferase [Woeseiaceae bacterium]
MNVVSFYCFVDVRDPAALRDDLQGFCDRHGLLGTVLLASEGINGTVAGAPADLQALLGRLGQCLGRPAAPRGRWTEARDAPFRRMRVKVKKEIVTLGRPDIRPQRQTGRHVSPAEWNALIDRPGTLLIDARNHYEIEVGSFGGAADPGTDRFREFVSFAEGLVEKERGRPVAMFCTGGIRCEKASALLLELGFGEVYQLEGGILNYLEQVGASDSRWHGECFVFDTRVAVDRDLAEGGYVQCHACRRPLSTEDLASTDYREGVSCPKCVGELEAERAARLEERRRQVALARERGQPHIGAKIE